MYELGDLVQMKKPHACQTNRFEIIRLGADIKIKCMGCGHIVMIPRNNFSKKFKKVLLTSKEVDTSKEEHYLIINK
ncbi:DUF951 domain-containing protein [Companilactobacillus metriopterae]|uniref:DUF951 domain-containing protein n=1 Tax=Companilactobacillus metriopterae TaxID=1909267 RepID=UPI00100B2D2A|nr:DUF951 domain-containing protein [Companilactobacillus metriopterae]